MTPCLLLSLLFVRMIQFDFFGFVDSFVEALWNRAASQLGFRGICETGGVHDTLIQRVILRTIQTVFLQILRKLRGHPRQIVKSPLQLLICLLHLSSTTVTPFSTLFHEGIAISSPPLPLLLILLTLTSSSFLLILIFFLIPAHRIGILLLF